MGSVGIFSRLWLLCVPFRQSKRRVLGVHLSSAPLPMVSFHMWSNDSAQTEPREISPYFFPKSVTVFHLTYKSAPRVQLILPRVRGPGGRPRALSTAFNHFEAFCTLARNQPVFAWDHLWAPRSGPARSGAGHRGGRHPAGLGVTHSRLSLFFRIISMITWVSADDVQIVNYHLSQAA